MRSVFQREPRGRKRIVVGGAAGLALLLLIATPGFGQSEEAEEPEPTAPAEQADEPAAALPEEDSERVRRTTINVWKVDVTGATFEDFPNAEAERQIKNWLSDQLGEFPVFKVVNRDVITQALGEQGLVATGLAEDASNTVLREAGKIAKVNYFMKGEVTNYRASAKTQVNFYLIDVDDLATDVSGLQEKAEWPFNPDLRVFQNDLKGVVAKFAEKFPLEVDVAGDPGGGMVELAAGSRDGITEDNEVEIVRRDGEEWVASGYVVSTSPTTSRVRMEPGGGAVDPATTVARVKVLTPAQAALSRGQRYYDEKRYTDALSSFDKGLRLEADDGSLLAGRARALHALGQMDDALGTYGRALAHQPNDMQLLQDATRARFEAGRFVEIIDSLAKEDRARLSGPLGILLGMSYDAIERRRLAEDVYRDVERFHPTLPDVYLRLAMHELLDNDMATAERNLTRARDLDPTFTEAQLASAVLNGDPAAAAEIDEVTERRDFTSLTTAAEILVRGAPTRFSEAVDLARVALEANPRYIRARLIEAEALAVGDRAADAVTRLDEARRELPDNFALVWLSAKLAAQGENPAAAAPLLLEAKKLAPQDPRPSELMGDVYAAQENYLAAADEYEDSLRLQGEARKELTGLYLKVGRSYARAQQYGKAIQPLTDCVRLAASNEECHYYLGVSQFESKLGDDAFRSFQGAASINERYFYIAQIYGLRGEVADSANALRQCIESGSAFVDECDKRLDEIESITGQIVEVDVETGNATIDVGRNYGVDFGMEAFVVGVADTTIEIKEVDAASAQGSISRGKSVDTLRGRKIRFRPTRPEGLSAQATPKKGVTLTWQSNPEEEVAQYLVYRSELPTDSLDAELKRLKVSEESKQEFVDKTAKKGQTYYYWVKAESSTGAVSLESRPSMVRVE